MCDGLEVSKRRRDLVENLGTFLVIASFLEYQTHNTQDQKELNERIFNLSRKYGIQTIIGLDTHYISEEDRIKRDNLLIRKGLHYDDEDGWYMDFPNGRETYRRMMNQNVLPEEEILYAMMNTHVFISGCEDIQYSKASRSQSCSNIKDITTRNEQKFFEIS